MMVSSADTTVGVFALALGTTFLSVSAAAQTSTSDRGPNTESATADTDDAEENDGEAQPVQVPTVEVASEEPSSTRDSRSTRSRSEISSEELDRRGFDTLGEALQSLSGSSVSSSAQSSRGAIVEGLPASQLTVLRDGLPVARKQGSRSGTSVDLSSVSIEPDEIERIEIYRGLGPAGTGDAGGVVVNIVSRTGAEHLEVGADGGLTGVPMELATGRVSGDVSAPVGDRWSLRAVGGYGRDRALDIDRDGTFDLPADRRWNAAGSLRWQPGSERRLRLRLAATHKRTDVLGVPDSPLYTAVETGDYRAHVTGSWRPASLWKIQHGSDFGYYRHLFSKVVRDSGFERPKADTRQYGTAQNLVATRFFSRHDLAFELAAEADRIERFGESGSLAPVHLATVGGSVDETWYVDDDWTLNARLYGDLHNRFGPGWLARVGSAWRFADGWRLQTSVSRTRRLPTAEELFLFFDHSKIGYQIEGNSNLSPETNRSARLGLHAEWLDRRLQASVEGFYHRLSELIGTVSEKGGTPDSGVAQFTYDNIAQAHTAGVDVGFDGRRVAWGLGFELNYTYLPLARNRTTGERLRLRPRHSGRLELRRRWFGDDLVTWTRADLRSEMPSGTQPAPGYAVAGVGFEWQVSRVVAASLEARNILDQTHPTWGPKPGFNVLAQMNVDWEQTDDST